MGTLDDIWKNLHSGEGVDPHVQSGCEGAGFLVICFTSQFIKTLISVPRQISILEL